LDCSEGDRRTFNGKALSVFAISNGAVAVGCEQKCRVEELLLVKKLESSAVFRSLTELSVGYSSAKSKDKVFSKIIFKMMNKTSAPLEVDGDTVSQSSAARLFSFVLGGVSSPVPRPALLEIP
jgi:hypothetical protein